MKCVISHESRGRIRIHAAVPRMSLAQADVLEYYLRSVAGVTKVKVYDRTCDAVVEYGPKAGQPVDRSPKAGQVVGGTDQAKAVQGGAVQDGAASTGAAGTDQTLQEIRQRVIRALSSFSFEDEEAKALVPDHTGRQANREFANRLAELVVRRIGKRLLMPHFLRLGLDIWSAAGYAWEGLKSLARGELKVAVLDGAAITVSILRGDHDTASQIMFLLALGDLLEEWVRKKSVDDLAEMMALNVDKVWRCSEEGEELVSVSEVREGEVLVVRTGNLIPLDGKVISGEAMVNQAAMTGEAMPIRKAAGSYVYGGTVVEDGECRFAVDKASGGGRYDRIVQMIEESEKLKSATEAKASGLADRLVPYSLAGTLIAYALTRNPQTALAFLMVDYSCALKLTMPLAVMSAMRESGAHSISVKGGKFLEEVSEADTIVFDKTGTLTCAQPTVAKVIPFGGNDEAEMLRLAACLEEHYPHSIANAVVEAARQRDLKHEERHTTVEYVVAHGITSMIDDQRASIGSYHFLFEDEGVAIPEEEQEKFDSLPEEYSLLYLAIDGKLAACLCIEDPLRENAPEVIRGLRQQGFRNIVMMTGDSRRTAEYIGGKAGVDLVLAEVLPEDKAAFVRKQREAGHKVIMIGDGVNDSPALSEASVGIAVNSGAAIAREIADITIEADDLETLLTLRKIADALMQRIQRDYRFIIGFNSALIGLGVLGILPPSASATMHNISTLGISMYNMTDLLPEG